MSASLDHVLQDFLVDSGLGGAEKPTAGNAKPRRRGAVGIKMEGVLVSCQTGAEEGNATSALASEEDELIWWAWDGKLTGFTEW